MTTTTQSDADGRCALSDLPVESCGCRKHRPDGGTLHVEPGNARSGGGHVYPLEYVQAARYPGKCPECQEWYQVGEMITPQRFKTIKTNTGRWAHQECAEEAS